MTTSRGNDNEIAWVPGAETISRARLQRFIEFCGLGSFAELQRRSTTDVAWFTERLLEFLDLRFDRQWETVLDLSRGIEWPQWCVGGQLNITKSCLDKWIEDEATAHAPALIWEGEEGQSRTLSYQELWDEVGLCAAGLRACGLGKGDAVGIHLPMVPETLIS
ncbi:MAG: AMP-binding protein, partial [Blastocatellia bacterium]